MKVLMSTDTVGGVWTYAVELARALAPAGVRVALATMGGALSDGQRRQAEALTHVELHESTYRLEWMADPWDDVHAAGEWLLEIARQFQPDVVHLNGYAHAQFDFNAPVLAAGHSCVLSWWEAVKGCVAPAAWDRYWQEVRDGLRQADLVVAPSQSMLHALDHFYGPLPASRVIANGRTGALYAAARPKEPLILTAGRLWDEAKNVAALAEVAGALPWPVYVAGEDRHPDGRSAQTEHLHLLGRLDEAELAGWYGRAGIYALPAKYEPFGLSALEAALSGCPLVLGDIPSLREVWGDAAIYTRPDDPDALRAALLDLIGDAGKRTWLAARARSRAAQYSPQRMAARYLDAYRRLLVPSHGSLRECQA